MSFLGCDTSLVCAVGILWLVALAIPFYGTINSLFSALTGGMTGYVLPCLAFNWYYRTAQRRADCPAKIPWCDLSPCMLECMKFQ